MSASVVQDVAPECMLKWALLAIRYVESIATRLKMKVHLKNENVIIYSDCCSKPEGKLIVNDDEISVLGELSLTR